MKTKFELGHLEQEFNYSGGVTSCPGYYELELDHHGFILDLRSTIIYKIFDAFFDLKEGDRVALGGVDEYLIVRWKCFDIDNDLVWYELQTDESKL